MRSRLLRPADSHHPHAIDTATGATLLFRDAAPAVRYEIDRTDRLLCVDAAWSSFATANGALHLVAGRVIGRSLWDFVSGETTRQVYKSLLRRVRDGGRSRFAYRCDAPGRRRFMEMTMTAGLGGRVRFESRTRLVEYLGDADSPGFQTSPPASRAWCDWCGEGQSDAWHPGRDYAPGVAPAPEMCQACVESVMQSVEYPVVPRRDRPEITAAESSAPDPNH